MMTEEEMEECLEAMMPGTSREVRAALVTLACDLITSGAPNGEIFTIRGSGDDSIVVEARYNKGKTAAEIIVETRQTMTAVRGLLAQSIAIIDERNQSETHLALAFPDWSTLRNGLQSAWQQLEVNEHKEEE